MDSKIKQAVILAGGQGTRWRPLTYSIPKPMIPVCGKPFLEHLIILLKSQGVEEVVLLLGYLPEKITEYFGDGKRFGLNIKYSITDVGDETGTRVKKATHLLDDIFLLLYADNYWPLDLGKLSEFYENQNTLASVTVCANRDGVTKNNISVDANGLVVKYDKSRQVGELNGVEIGFFVLSKKVLDLLPDSNCGFEETALPELILQKQLSAYVTEEKYYSISTPERIKKTEEFFANFNL